MFPKVTSVINQKGGVGKTTTAINMASIIAIRGYKTLLIDMDSQANLSIGIKSTHDEKDISSFDLLTNRCKLNDALHKSIIPNLDFVKGSLDLAAVDIEFAALSNREYYLHNALANQVRDYDYIFIDCPPSLGLLTINSLVASDQVIIPLQCEIFSVEGSINLIRTMKLISRSWNKKLILSGILLTMIDKRIRMYSQVEADLREQFGSTVFQTIIPRNAAISIAASYGKPVILHDPRSAGAVAYNMLASEFMTPK